MAVPNDLYYANTHEWLRIDENIATVGITDFAQNQLSDITFVELPDVGREVEAGDEVAVVESVKAASDIYAPVAGTIVEVNGDLEDSPDMINASPYNAGWLFKIEVRKEEDVDNLMSAEEYAESCDEEPEIEED
jgi:glycine cleavage system H protein